jgi:hypothetical protein
MMRCVCGMLLLAVLGQAAEPIAGKWLLQSQQVNGRDTGSRPLTLNVTQKDDVLAFEYAVPMNQQEQVSLRFAARLDGSAADITDSGGRKIGTAKLTRRGTSEYLLMLEGPSRPTSSGRMTVSGDGRTLVSESDAAGRGGDKLHTVQTFVRQ